MVERLVNTEVNDRRVENVETCFGTSGQPLALYGRVLVGEGVLVKMCRKKPKPRQFFLFNDILVYGNILISKKRYNKQRIIPLEEIQLQDLEDDGEMRNGWLIKTRSKSFAVFAAANTEKKEWMAHIEKCVEDVLTKGKKAATAHAAVWIPDSEANKCMICNKTQFTVLQRRHHCRSCGSVVCSACSSHNFLMPGLSKRPVRVCDKCYENLLKGGVTMENSPTDSVANNDSSDSEEEDRGNAYDRQPTFYSVQESQSLSKRSCNVIVGTANEIWRTSE